MDVTTPLVGSTAHASYATTSTTRSNNNSNRSHTSSSTMKVVPTPPPSSSVRKNPFRYDTPIDTYERIKIVVICLVGVPLLRVVLIALILLTVIVVSNIALLGWRSNSNEDNSSLDAPLPPKRMLPRWRQWLASPVPLLARAGLFVCGYYWIPITTPSLSTTTKHSALKANRPRIVVSNHISFIDGLFLLSYLRPSIAMKAEVATIPLLGKVVQTTQPILIDRTTPTGRKHAMMEIAAHIANTNAPPLLIFPEGTTSNQDYLTKFKVGSFAAGVACQPVLLRYPFKHFDVSWTPGVSGLYLACRMLCQVYNRLEVQFLDVYTPTELEKQTPALFAENVRQQMARALGVECTNHAFEDVALLLNVGTYAHEHVVPLTDVREVRSLTDLRSSKDVEKLVAYFVKHDVNHDGQISLEELTQLFRGDDPALLARLFALIDANGNGQIDFRELCIALRALSASRTDSGEELLKFAFGLYDLNNNGVIDATELASMLQFHESFYGASPASTSGSMSLRDCVLGAEEAPPSNEKSDKTVTFDAFAELMAEQPELLAYARSKLEMLRGSLRE